MEPNKIRIHQLLHGYDEGHRLLAGSIKLDGQSAKTLLALSDLSGQGAAPGPAGYITGYPLPQMGAYALARTWLAPEMPRPGCVWTHTLLIDFSDLSVIGSVSLLDLFKRPCSSQEDILSYGHPLTAEASTPKIGHPQLPSGYIVALLKAVYELPKECIFVQAHEEIPADRIAVALWLQQWPRLQRNFRFCTWATSDRSRSDEPFDLQFSPQKRSIRRRNSGKNPGHWVDTSVPVPEPPYQWTASVAKDIVSENPDSLLRKFLWRYGAETENGRAAFKPLVQVWQALENSPDVDVVSAVAAVEEIHPAIASLSLRLMHEVARFSTPSAALQVSVIQFIVRNLSLLPAEGTDEDEILKFATMIWRYSPADIWPLFGAESKVERLVATAAAGLMQPDEALSGAGGNADVFCAVLTANTKLAASPLVWDSPAPIPKRAIETLSVRGNPDSATMDAMLEADNADLPQIAIDAFGQVLVNAAVEYYDKHSAKDRQWVRRWLIEAGKHPELLITSVAQADLRDIETLAFIATLVNYRSPSISGSRDEWVHALASIRGDLGDRTFGFYAFLLARALSGASPEPGSLVCSSFDIVHNDLMRSWSGKEEWSMLERELPELSWWNSWDRAHRLRLGVVRLFLNRSLPPHEFLEITKDEYIFKKLADIAASSSAGRSYLRHVSSWAKGSGGRNLCSSGRIAEDAIQRAKWFS